MTENEQWTKTWQDLPFSGFNTKYFEQGKKEEHMREAAIILNFLETGNVGLIAKTAAGKTIMSLLNVLAKRYRTLFLTSRVDLATQHHEMLDKITGSVEEAATITGKISQKKRVWNNPATMVIFATPHVALREHAKGKLNLSEFDLIIFDEFHNASGNYPYVPLVQIAKQLPQPPKFLCLSASPADSAEKIDDLEKLFSIRHWHVADIATPQNKHDFILVELTAALIEMDALFQKLFRKVDQDLRDAGWKIEPEKFLTWSELELIARKNKRRQGRPAYYKTLQFLTTYLKLNYAYVTAFTESYGTFLDYCFSKLENDRSRSGMSIISDPVFRRIIALAATHIDDHPKEKKLLEVLQGESLLGKNALIFVWQKKTGEQLCQKLLNAGLRAEIIAGGAGKNTKKQKTAMENLRSGKLDYLIATSVIEEGLNVSEVNAVIQYSMPKTGISRKQRSGRTGRLDEGHILFLVLDHPLDRASYWAKAHSTKKIEALIAQKSGQVPAEQQPPSTKKNSSRKKDELTLSLF